ncbi:MAG: FecR domain-containing protein [Verrucomicrobia bacterium]|nr:FecR domain-containing protein [Verrucomicrobiota bacterium]
MSKQVLLAVVAVSVSLIVSARLAVAGPLTQAQVTKIINQVSLVDPQNGERPAVVRDVIKDDLGVETGVKSRSELLFQDNTLTRLGAETFFSFKTGTRDLTLEKGSMLLQVPKGLGGAKIHTAAVTAAITGTTIMMEYIPKKYIKVMVLEGSLRLSRNGFLGDSVVLTAGKMVIMRPDAKNIPEPVNVDLQHVVQTSTLVNFPNTEPLPSMNLIEDAIAAQQHQLANTNLVPTNLVIGKGTNVIVATNDQLAKLTGSTGLLGATLQSPTGLVKNDVLPIVNNVGTTVTSTLGSTVGTVNTLLNSTTGTLSGVTNNLLTTTTGAVTSIPISSTTQLASLLDTATPTITGTVAVVPSTVGTTVATVSGVVTGTTSAVTSTTTGLVNSITNSPTSTSATPNSPLTSTTLAPVTTVVTTTTTGLTGLLGHH